MSVLDGEKTDSQKIFEKRINAVERTTRTATNDRELSLTNDDAMRFRGQAAGINAEGACPQRGAVSNKDLVWCRPGWFTDNR